jgi:outer membrane lipoprotein-sorting protein
LGVRPSRPARRAAAALLVALAFSACATPHLIPGPPWLAEPRHASPEEILGAYDAYCSGIRTFSGSGDLELRDLRAGKSRRVGVRFVAARGGRLYLKGSVLVVTALEVVSDGERFWFEVPSKKTVWTGLSDAGNRAEGADKAPYYALRPRDVTSAFLPEALAPDDGDALLFEADRQSFAVTVARIGNGRGYARRRVSLDRETLQLVRARDYDARGDVITDASFGGWSGGVPHQVTIERPSLGYVASFALDRAESNVAVPDRAFAARTPEGYTVEEVRD